MSKTPDKPSIYEKCIICKNKTFIKKNQQVAKRSSYIKGLGQLCKCCFLATNNTSTVYCDLYEN